MDYTKLVRYLFGSEPGSSFQKGGVSTHAKNPRRGDYVNAIMRGMSRPKRDNDDLPAGIPVMTAMAQDPNKTKLNPMAATEGARGYSGGIVRRKLPGPHGGTTLEYHVLERHGDGTITVRGKVPDGYPQDMAKPIRVPESVFSDTQQAKPYKK